jgi:hypothetical protein
MSRQQTVLIERQPCYFFQFGLIVTGKGEREHLPKLFRSLMTTGICTFEVIRFVGQRSPRTSEKKRPNTTGTTTPIPKKDEEEISLPARGCLNRGECHFVVLIDDLEHNRRNQAQQVFDRYRQALDTVLKAAQKPRTSVHFLVNMLEAYYFADAKAINAVLGTALSDDEGDVEIIRHPKNELKKRYPGFREIEHVLSRPDTCVLLRTLFAWCVKVLEQYPGDADLSLSSKYQLHSGRLSEITRSQLDNL